MGEMVWADRPDGGQVGFDPERCVRFPLRPEIEDYPKPYLYYRPEDDLWIYAEERIQYTFEKGTHWHPAGPTSVPFVKRSCRIVTREKARDMSREAGLHITELEQAGGGS